MVPQVTPNKPKQRILIIDNDAELGKSLQTFLLEQEFDVTLAHTGAKGRAYIATGTFKLVLLDLNLPDDDGFNVIQDIRRVSFIPIIMLTDRRNEIDRVLGLDLGADDYVTKPFCIGELTARIRAVLRCVAFAKKASSSHDKKPRVACFGGWRLEFANRRLLSPDCREARLTHSEFRLMQTFVKHPLQILSRVQLWEAIGEDPAKYPDRAIDIRIARLRKKIESDPGNPVLIRTERGIGYVLIQKVVWQ